MKHILYIFLTLAFARCISSEAKLSSQLPSIDLLLADSITHINTGTIRSGSPVALLYFSPDCEHCQHEIQSIKDRMDSLKNIRFYLITNDSLSRIKIFNAVYDLAKYENITTGWDTQFQFPRQFKNAFPPYLVLYDRNLQKIGDYEGGLTPTKIYQLANR